MKSWTWVAAAALIAAGVGGGVWSASQLAGGAADIPGHWWSALASAPLAAGLALAAAAASRGRFPLPHRG
ncbi:MAG: hypothetical protein ACR2HN_07485 [Tepidiformaceae bacterium]